MKQTILISGAGQGIGAEIAKTFYDHGYYVGLFDLNIQAVDTLAQQLGSRAYSGYLDVSDYASWQTALEQFMTWAGQLNILINNAGILYSGCFESINIEAHQRTMAVNCMGVLNGCHAALPYLKQSNFARVINLSSASAIYGQADLASYSASKFAVRGLTEALDIEWSKYNIRVLDVMPLFVQTAMVKDMDAGSIQNIGVDLTPRDVAIEVLKLAQKEQTTFQATHTPVGLKTKILYQLSSVSPQLINRLSNLWLSRRNKS
ncbi:MULTISPECIES: SDR family oxidoreductase [Acinetobacter]|uniref:Putative short-chain dehydrogenase n=1 Tax=Acinetobacter baylyi (strain ATCC 33305 / BD413 / ADP1) TaxID=62977 RepID=Q6F849_ACIAD|nr:MULTISPECIES: SDR family oxidoreductase [Acinetobacter]ENV54903.1 hypothetical protein F952_00985 [Acinetobacter baylyi DSM 14961 = CIP 107474]KAF2370204.1 short-chain dehydrogenase [Acinetobacter baylyi]KAF2371319.1 short-chain dehydrogenase [Acinetobacter baylyi]KAF2378130.1 short-chain dehydrogenase [Acinetobacter baylyi]KAF2379629.1 short-chain dehydrogenase [Acinetobacter baylyi]